MAESGVIAWDVIFGTADQASLGEVPEVWSGDGVMRTQERCAEWAAQLGCDLVVASDRELFIDIDTEHQFQVFSHVVRALKTHIACKVVRIDPSKQELPHRHIVVELREPLPLVVRVALQAALGSDPMRELLSTIRAMNGEENVVLFFEKKKENN